MTETETETEIPFSLEWEPLGNAGSAHAGLRTERARVFGGWLVHVGAALTFVPDPEGRWDGEDFGEDDYEYEEEEEDDEGEEEEEEGDGDEDGDGV